ncbi:hypothetical protein BDZ97DRAFT_1759304 [Flammula alnicola]|nr:hypothetical protein BDZ97DRAFT_1759304 [Flammula alnicola]
MYDECRGIIVPSPTTSRSHTAVWPSIFKQAPPGTCLRGRGSYTLQLKTDNEYRIPRKQGGGVKLHGGAGRRIISLFLLAYTPALVVLPPTAIHVGISGNSLNAPQSASPRDDRRSKK